MYHLANFNRARARAETDDPVMHGFTSRLDEINALADAAPGFVWRLQTPSGNATELRPYPDLRWLVNLSVWESVESLQAFVYRGGHRELVAGGRAWFEPSDQPTLVLWWIPVGERPSLEEGVARLDRLHREGPSAAAFSFRQPFPSPTVD